MWYDQCDHLYHLWYQLQCSMRNSANVHTSAPSRSPWLNPLQKNLMTSRPANARATFPLKTMLYIFTTLLYGIVGCWSWGEDEEQCGVIEIGQLISDPRIPLTPGIHHAGRANCDGVEISHLTVRVYLSGYPRISCCWSPWLSWSIKYYN